MRTTCYECKEAGNGGGGGICEHGKPRWDCVDAKCGGCKHGRRKRDCRCCKGECRKGPACSLARCRSKPHKPKAPKLAEAEAPICEDCGGSMEHEGVDYYMQDGEVVSICHKAPTHAYSTAAHD